MKITHSIILTAAALVTAGCMSDYDDGTTPLDNAAWIDVAEASPESPVLIRKDMTEISRELSVKLISPSTEDVEFGIRIDESVMEQYNTRHGTSYTLLPEEYWSMNAESVSIEQGKVLSKPIDIKFKNLEKMELDKTWLLPMSIISSGGIGTLKGSEKVCFVVKRSSAITTAADLSDCYMWIPSYETPEGWSALENLTALTYEALVNVKDFNNTTASGIGVSVTSIMGVEQWMLMRIGDAGYPRQQIQMNLAGDYWPGNGLDFYLPAITLEQNEWYHIAFTWDLLDAVGKIYINGKLAHKAPMSWKDDKFSLNCLKEGGPDDEGRRFFIGYSYDPDRPLVGLISEVRVWSVARTEEEIFRDMYEVKEPETKPELRGYWKFDEGRGNEVIDHSQYGNNAFCLDGKNNFELKERNEGKLLWNNSVEIPILNKIE